jgi:phage virion morphogenesis protein
MAGASFSILEKIDDREVQRAIARLVDKADKPAAAFKNIGEYLVRTTRRRFDDETDPTGRKWRLLHAATLKRKRIQKILTESSGLKDSVIYSASARGVRVGTNKVYAAAHQFGFKGTITVKAHKSLRTTVFKRRLPFPVWAEVRAHPMNQNIPARPFLGISLEDRAEILAITGDFLVKR